MPKSREYRPMPERQAADLKKAFLAFRTALDPFDPWANRRLATAIRAADAAGWSRRSTAAALGLSRVRTERLGRSQPDSVLELPRYEFGEPYPAMAVSAFRAAEDEVNLRRIRTERVLIAYLRAAHYDAGWPYKALGAITGSSPERLRQLADSALDVGSETAPVFEPFQRALKPGPSTPARGKLSDAEAARLATLAAAARTARRPRLAVGTGPAHEASLAAREASRDLSALIIALKRRDVPWPELDAACGYKPGGARVRAIRDGYATTPMSRTAHARSGRGGPSALLTDGPGL